MQYVEHSKDYNCISPVLNDLERLYKNLSEKKLTNDSGLLQTKYPESFKLIEDVFNEFSGFTINIPTEKKNYPIVNLPKYDEKNIIVCFSGGKDSIVTAKYFKDRGYNVYLYFLKGLKLMYPKDYEYAKESAEYLGLPLYIDEIHLHGKHKYFEDHPLSRVLLYNSAISYGVRNSIGVQIASGDFITSYLEDNNFEVNAADTADMNGIYDTIVSEYIPDFKLLLTNETYHDAYDLLLTEPDLLKLSVSCMSFHRWRAYRQSVIEKKFNIKLFPHRCGMCWKCASEYIYYADHSLYPVNKEYYIYCLNVLVKTGAVEKTVKISLDVKDVWNEWLFYPIEESKLYPEILDIKLKLQKFGSKKNANV